MSIFQVFGCGKRHVQAHGTQNCPIFSGEIDSGDPHRIPPTHGIANRGQAVIVVAEVCEKFKSGTM